MGSFGVPILPLFFNFLNIFLQLISWLNKIELLIFKFGVVQRAHYSLCSQVSVIRLTAVTQEKCILHTYPSAQICLSTIFPIQALGYGKLYHHLGFSSTVTNSFKILTDRNNHSFPWIPTACCSNLYSAYQSAFYYLFLTCLSALPPFPDYKLLDNRDRVLFIFMPITVSTI